MTDEHEPRPAARTGAMDREVDPGGPVVSTIGGDALIPVLDGLPIPLLARAADGTIVFANGPARSALHLDDALLCRAHLTRIRRAGPREAPVFLLTVDGDSDRRIEAQAVSLQVDAPPPYELLLLDCTRTDLARAKRALDSRPDVPAAVRGGLDLLLQDLPEPGRRGRAKRTAVKNRRPRGRMDVRDLVAHSLRRARCYVAQGGGHRLRLIREPDLRGRHVRADAVAVAQVVLSGLSLIEAGATGAVRFHAILAGARLRIVLEACGPPAARNVSNLVRHHALTRSIAEILRTHGATFEVHQGSTGSRRTILTLPTEPVRTPPSSS